MGEQTIQAPQFSDAMFIGTAIYVLVLGIVALVVGWRVRQLWVAFWGVTMVLAAGAYLAAVSLGYR